MTLMQLLTTYKEMPHDDRPISFHPSHDRSGHSIEADPEEVAEMNVRKGKGVVYYDEQSEKFCMIRCVECGRENWAPAVSGGTCAWCGFDFNAPNLADPNDAAVFGSTAMKIEMEK